jgi:hypothetical protein
MTSYSQTLSQKVVLKVPLYTPDPFLKVKLLNILSCIIQCNLHVPRLS